MKRKLRTIAKNLRTKERVLVTLLFAFVLSCMSIGYAYYQTEVSLEANIKLLKGEFEISSAQVFKTKNSSVTGDIEIAKNETAPNAVLLSEFTVDLTGNDKNNYVNIRYVITNNTKETYTYTGFSHVFSNYEGEDPSNLRAPKLYGIIPGDKIAPGESREVDLIYIASSDLGDTTFTVIPSFIFDSSNPDVAVPSLECAFDTHGLKLQDDGMTSVGVNILNTFDTTVKYTLSITTDKYELTNNSGTASNYANTLTPGDNKKTTLYFRLLDESVAEDEIEFNVIATLEDGTEYVFDTLKIGKNVIPDLPFMKAETNETKSEDQTNWAGHYNLYVDITNNYDKAINSWTVYIYPKDTAGFISAGSDSNTVSYENGIIKLTSKELYSNNLISIAAGATYTSGRIGIVYDSSKTFEIEKYEVYANVEDVEPNTNTTYTETILNGTDPVIPDNNNFIPVTISDNGTVKRASASEVWYNYGNGKWANAVLLAEDRGQNGTGTGNYYYAEGATIDERDIVEYLVWIPRFKYKLFNVTTTNAQVAEQVIQVFFETTEVAASTGHANGEFLTHPAFTDINKNGFWIGKFEVTNDWKTKPNVTALRNRDIANFYMGMIDFKSGLGSHLVTNMEWGATGYLAHSKYGKGTTKVAMNANSQGKTGCGPTSNSSETTECLNAYGTATSYPQSTTGNITGVFDMTGGSFEYVAATVVGERAGSYSTMYDTIDTILLGDGLTEPKNWFVPANDYSYRSKFTSTEKYYVRGGASGEGVRCTIFNYWRRNGEAGSRDSARIAFDV